MINMRNKGPILVLIQLFIVSPHSTRAQASCTFVFDVDRAWSAWRSFDCALADDVREEEGGVW